MGHVEIIADHYFFFPPEFFWVTCQSHQFPNVQSQSQPETAQVAPCLKSQLLMLG